jgi:glycerol-3-phosphate dehydrogenase
VDLTGEALLRHAVEHEMVVTLADAVIRRTPLGSLGRPADDTIAACAAIVGDTLGWSPTRRQYEVEHLERFYR